ncbi:unnamed protein product [Lymnaea stagnalis]|uniref:THD domain-containing protein n=1 Tax=Lymnaea stagnalis TaxID=6523 RepID=A0AAV2I7C4_LYMST
MNGAATCIDVISSRSHGYTSEQGKRPNSELHRRIVLALCVTSIIICLVVLQVSVQTLFRTSGRAHKKDGRPIACVDCKKLQISDDPFEHDALLSALEPVTDGNHGVTRCCAFNEPQLSALFEISMRRQEVRTGPLPAFNVSDFSLSPASALRRLYPPYNPAQKVYYKQRVPIFVPGNVGLLFQIEGSTIDQLVEHTRGVDVLEDGMRITQPGLYYVYSSITFRPESGHPCKNFAYKTWKHFVNVRREGEDRTLLTSVHTCCDDCVKDETTRFTGGVFRLDVNDTIRLAISGHALASFQQQSSSFAGVTMLGLPVPSGDHG